MVPLSTLLLMPKFKLSPTIEAKYILDESQTSPTLTIVGFGDIDLRYLTEADLLRLKEKGINLSFLRPRRTTKPKSKKLQ